jgi:hypothetical protein
VTSSGCLIQFRAAGLQVKRPTSSPVRVSITTMQGTYSGLGEPVHDAPGMHETTKHG